MLRCANCGEWFYVDIDEDEEANSCADESGLQTETRVADTPFTITHVPVSLAKDDPRVREDATNLFRFLRDVVELRSKTVRTVEQYERDGHVLWLSDVPRESGCASAAWPLDDAQRTSGSAWLEIDRPRLEESPAPPSQLRPWLDPGEVVDSSLEYPELLEVVPASRLVDDITLPVDDGGMISFESVDGLLDVWTEYVEKRWQPWAVRNRRLQPVQALYNDLFSIHQIIQSRGDEFELVVGVALLQWRTSGHEVRRHLLTTRAELAFESERGRIVLGPGPEGSVLRLEQDMLEVGDRPSPDELGGILVSLDTATGDVFHGDDLRTVAAMWVNSAASDGRFLDQWPLSRDAWTSRLSLGRQR